MSEKSPLYLKRFSSSYAILYVPFFESNSNLVQTDDLGNVFPAENLIEVFAYLKPTKSKDDLRQVGLVGAQGIQIYVTGYLVMPKQLPSGINPPLRVRAKIGAYTGILSIAPKLPAPFGSEQITGERLEGWFGAEAGHY